MNIQQQKIFFCFPEKKNKSHESKQMMKNLSFGVIFPFKSFTNAWMAVLQGHGWQNSTLRVSCKVY